tara:strand:- start:3101 stop:3280 length:180 start_codon:yes stop_codon:yes gene_type:complete
MKNLESFGVQELSINSQKNNNGGFLLPVIIGALWYFAFESATNPKASEAAFTNGWNDAQ